MEFIKKEKRESKKKLTSEIGRGKDSGEREGKDNKITSKSNTMKRTKGSELKSEKRD